MQIIYLLVTRPFGIVLMALYNVVGSYGISILLFTLAVRLVLMPLQVRARKSTAAMSQLSPKIQEIQRKYKNDKVKINEEMQKLYASNDISPSSGCLPMLIQLPILWGLYGIIQKPLTFMMGLNTSQLKEIAAVMGLEYTKKSRNIELDMAGLLSENFDKLQTLGTEITSKLVNIDFHFLCFDLTQTPSIKDPSILWLIPILSGLTSLLYSFLNYKFQKQSMPKQQRQQGFDQMKYMMAMMPLMSVYFGFILPACLGVYWIAGNVLMFFQEIFIVKVLKIQTPAPTPQTNQPRERKPQLDQMPRTQKEIKQQMQEMKNIPNKSKKKHKK